MDSPSECCSFLDKPKVTPTNPRYFEFLRGDGERRLSIAVSQLVNTNWIRFTAVKRRFEATKFPPRFNHPGQLWDDTVSPIPSWIDDRIDRNLDNTLTQEHVVETMLESDRPFFSIRQLHARIKPDVSRATVRNRLRELQEIDVVATESYPDSITLYYVNHPESEWPLSPEGERALNADTPLDRLSTRGFLTFSDTAGIRTLVLAGFQLSLVLFALGGVLAIIGSDITATQSDIVLWDTAFDLLLVSLALLVVERLVRWVRDKYGPLTLLPST